MVASALGTEPFMEPAGSQLALDRFVSRIEPRIDLANAHVQELNIWSEDGFAPRRGFVDAVRGALRAYLRFAGASPSNGRPLSRNETAYFSPRP